MKSLVLLEAIGGIDEKFIEEATPKKAMDPKRKWLRYGIVAACFLIVLAIPYYNIVLKGASAEMTGNNNPDVLKMVDYNNAYYEICEDKKFLERNGLPEEVTPDVIGAHVAYLIEINENTYYEEIRTESGCELFEYAPQPCEGVYILRDGENYHFILFCNYHVPSGSSLPLEEAFGIYGVDSADDIAAVYQTFDDQVKIGREILDKAKIQSIYAELLSLEASSFDEYYQEFFGEENSGGRHAEFADGYSYWLTFKTKGGVVFRFKLYEEFGWLYSTQTMTYYRVTDSLLTELSPFFV